MLCRISKKQLKTYPVFIAKLIKLYYLHHILNTRTLIKNDLNIKIEIKMKIP